MGRPGSQRPQEVGKNPGGGLRDGKESAQPGGCRGRGGKPEMERKKEPVRR